MCTKYCLMKSVMTNGKYRFSIDYPHCFSNRQMIILSVTVGWRDISIRLDIRSKSF